LAAHLGVQVIGIDPSQKMLDQARRKPAARNVVHRRAAAEALSLPDGCADLAFMSMVYHHLSDSACGGSGMPPRIAPERLRLRPRRHA
jgi:ubiquinone/menaquinone biosynthesis C-methylase UbiE